MRNTKIICECCGATEGGCVRGRPTCACDNETDNFLFTVILCPDCDKCPTHCKCIRERCHCATKFLGHKSDCDVRIICKAKINRANALDQLDSAERKLKAYGINLGAE